MALKHLLLLATAFLSACSLLSAQTTFNIRFQCDNGNTVVGESIYVSGNVVELGQNDLNRAVIMTPQVDPVFSGRWIEIIALRRGDRVTWRCVWLKEDGRVFIRQTRQETFDVTQDDNSQFNVDITAMDQEINAFRFSKVINVLAGFSMGASSIALFARVGGSIYTKAADGGADLVGKIEAAIPEDHFLNPATIADNAGDSVGDVAGMGPDLFESYVGSLIGAVAVHDAFEAALMPLILAAVGIVVPILGTFFVRTQEGGNP